jgi:hypothetical protein
MVIMVPVDVGAAARDCLSGGDLQQIFIRLIPIASWGWETLTVEVGLTCAG